ncbi:XRE family transcriptional regulator [Corynebacterium yudongzhengii]|uniref:XRE family transcriptional regulator n=1 Tax=Corynebacterium yudongzhengii TaxID=2080740 RepID=A0A2U1T714_9CORY|nr:short-chain fatty acyl-CoA regulator family protein [Corynebacterium yudongzhengii]AWB81357.1 XRE family transcriptional regulator [Corynebacterium yudongzhengii]PWC01800.1 XRE family transcriptional regulator [Corynebacterium yudongzhengii]
MAKLFAGGRIRTLRRGAELTQTEMARRLDISTSYLNQLENDQRPLTVTVLMNLARSFDVDPTFFSEDADARTVAALHEALPRVPAEQLSDLAARYPHIAEELTDQLHTPNQDPGAYALVRDYFYETRNYIHSLDTAGEQLAADLGSMQLRVGRLADRLERDAGVTVNFRGDVTGPARHFDRATRALTLRTGLRHTQLCFQMALQYALIVHDEHLGELAAELPTEESREIARLGLAQYFAAAVTLPYTEFLQRAEETRYDVEKIAYHFSASFESTSHRLSSLQRPGARGVPFFFVRTDRAGNISKRQSATGFHFSRSSATCPLWVIHRAFETPARVTRQVASMPDGRSYLWVARYVAAPARGFGKPRKEFAVALGCDLDQAHRLVYSDGLELTAEAATPIGPGCTACPRRHCPQRAFPEAGKTVVVDLETGSEERYLTRD